MTRPLCDELSPNAHHYCVWGRGHDGPHSWQATDAHPVRMASSMTAEKLIQQAKRGGGAGTVVPSAEGSAIAVSFEVIEQGQKRLLDRIEELRKFPRSAGAQATDACPGCGRENTRIENGVCTWCGHAEIRTETVRVPFGPGLAHLADRLEESQQATGTSPTEEYLPDQAACSHRKWRRSFDILTCERCATVIDYTGPEGGRE